MALILTSNEVVINPDHAWKNIEGVQYHYPNQYKNLIKPGERFVYYRGVRRKDGRRDQAEYFGVGIIGEIKIDSETADQSRPSWFCSIEDYKPFAIPVPAKVDGTFFENIPSNLWRNGVRSLPDPIYEKIISESGVQQAPAPPIELATKIDESGSLLVPKKKAVGGSSSGAWRKSKRAKQVGDWAEDAAMKFVRESLGENDVTYRAGMGEKPGWDFEYTDKSGLLHRIEVKGTVSAAFTSIDLTVREYEAAKAHKESYWLYLVANCLTDHPKVQRVQDPASKIESNEWSAEPMLFNITFAAT
ncbi:MAG TPA: DUF3883 domain-containing protein [Rhizomicrobium sp.]|nr:DUF3883 domain-containing protein [Rhizomicrobium sp.]